MMKICSVDDSRAVHAYLNETFAGSEVVLSHHMNGQQLLDALAAGKEQPDLILLDWEMPVLSGIEALPQIAKLNPKTLVVMMTSKNAMADITAALEKGASDYIIKPFTKDIIFGKIELLLGKKVA